MEQEGANNGHESLVASSWEPFQGVVVCVGAQEEDVYHVSMTHEVVRFVDQLEVCFELVWVGMASDLDSLLEMRKQVVSMEQHSVCDDDEVQVLVEVPRLGPDETAVVEGDDFFSVQVQVGRWASWGGLQWEEETVSFWVPNEQECHGVHALTESLILDDPTLALEYV